jgi:leucyl aminopeptidase
LGRVSTIPGCGRLAAQRLVVVGLGKKTEITVERVRRSAAAAIQAVRSLGICECAVALQNMPGLPNDSAALVVEGAVLGNYCFAEYRQAEDTGVAALTLLCPPSTVVDDLVAALRKAQTVSRWVLYARDLVSHPGNITTPAYLADRALELAGRFGLRCHVLDRVELEKLGMGGVIGVGKGGQEPPCFVVLEYVGVRAPKRPVVLIGKGVTFDTGGISLKPRENMERMKDDMAGAAAVLAATMAAAELGLPVRLLTLIPLAENMPDGRAYKPGDILRMLGGKTVEIVNTDAEGRLLLADALMYAQQFRPSVVIDLATLTGACMIALGTAASGLMGNDRRLLAALQQAGERCGERLWELPIWDEYGEAMKSDVADLKNAGGPYGGAVSAGWFLKQFIGDTSWAHIDIAGTAWEEKGTAINPKGATGVGVRLLVDYLCS